ncbi:hypothetical protein GCM10028827_08810 [Mucilaginibacter myungsuensis]
MVAGSGWMVETMSEGSVIGLYGFVLREHSRQLKLFYGQGGTSYLPEKFALLPANINSDHYTIMAYTAPIKPLHPPS